MPTAPISVALGFFACVACPPSETPSEDEKADHQEQDRGSADLRCVWMRMRGPPIS